MYFSQTEKYFHCFEFNIPEVVDAFPGKACIIIAPLRPLITAVLLAGFTVFLISGAIEARGKGRWRGGREGEESLPSFAVTGRREFFEVWPKCYFESDTADMAAIVRPNGRKASRHRTINDAPHYFY